MINSKFYLIHCKTHLHVGSGDSNYGVIDKLIQRDPSDDFPCIYGSSLKGALREYVEEALEQKPEAKAIFGDADGNKTRGSYIFHDALLLTIPQRSNKKTFYRATSKATLNKLVDMAKLFEFELLDSIKQVIAEIKGIQIETGAIIFESKPAGIKIEDFEEAQIRTLNINVQALEALLGDNLVLYSDNDFKEACSDYNLPVIARNNLEDGQSKNLWYEQILPRESQLFFAVSPLPGNNGDLEPLLNNATVQIGANATIGYGVTKISEIPNN